jgi:hypothetical protein
VYASAVLFYECVVGQVPYDAGNYNALLQLIISRPPVPPRARGAEISAPLEQVVMAALAKRREDRPPNARVFRELLLEAGLASETAQLEPATWKFRSVPAVPSLAPRAVTKPKPALDLEIDPFKPAPTGRHSLPRSSRHIEPVWSTPSLPMPSASAPPPPSLDPGHGLPPLTLDMDARGPARSQSIELALEPRRGPPGARRETRGRPSRARPSRPPRASGEATPSVLRGALRWLAVLAAIALLASLASALFTRRDARKPRREAAEPTEQPGTERAPAR